MLFRSITMTAVTSPVVPPGGMVDTVVTWTPYAAGEMADTLLIDSDDPDEARVEVPLSGSVPHGEIAIDPETWDFGTLAVGATDTVMITVSNVGDGPLTVSDWTFAATDADMTVLDAGDITALPSTLDPGTSAEVIIQYAPSAGGGDEGNLVITSDDPDTPTTGAQVFGNGEDPDPCKGFLQSMNLFITADDQWQGYLDGEELIGPNQYSWSSFDTFDWEVECGQHVLAISAQDSGQVIAGVIAAISVEGTVTYVTDTTHWRITDVEPDPTWVEVGFDDSSWNIPGTCSDTSPWGSTPQPFYDLGAEWIWWTSDCRDLGEGWLRLEFSVP